MTEQTNAEKLRISDGFVVWIIGSSVEETSVLDPMPEGAEMIEQLREDEERESVDAAIVFADDRTALADSFDDVLPRLGSIPLVWISYPIRDADIDEDAIQEITADYGWYAVESIILDETWAALRVEQT
jgi:hypothetical protein